MYPLQVILIGSDEELLPHVRRELLNCSAELEAEFPNTVAAINALRRTSAERRLVILHMESTDDVETLRTLMGRFPGWPVVALVDGYDPKSSLGEVVIGIMQAGASQILAMPIQANDFKKALERIAIQYVYHERRKKVIAVAGVSGGSGATTIALNLASEIASRFNLRTVLVDLSLHLGVIASLLDLEPTYSIIDLLQEANRVDSVLAKKVLLKITDNLQLLAGPLELMTNITTTSHDVAFVTDAITQLADVVVLDVPCTYDDMYFETIASADWVVLIGEQTLPSIRALTMVREAIRHANVTEHLVINRFDATKKGFTIQTISKPLGVSSLATIARDDVGISNSIQSSCPLALAAPRSPALADISALADAVLERDHSPRPRSAGLFQRLGRAITNA